MSLWTTDVLHRLRALRTRLGVTGPELADRLGVDQSTVSRLETGVRRMSLGHLEDIATALEVRVQLLMWEDGGGELEDEDVALLEAMAAVLPSMPRPRRQALAHEARLWREDSTP